MKPTLRLSAKRFTQAIGFAIVGVGAVLASSVSWADNDYFRPVTDPLTAEECSACHMLYPVGILPRTTWSEMMDGLDSHFGSNASLSPKVAQQIADYLTFNSPKPRRSLMVPIKAGTQDHLRITKLRWFPGEHDGRILSPANMLKYKAKSASSCKACHPKAEIGDFD